MNSTGHSFPFICTPCIAYPELDQSSLVLFDMAAFYLPLHDRDWPDYFPCQALLATVEALIYQIEIAIDQNRHWDWPNQAAQIRAFLAEHIDLDPAIDALIDDVGHYFIQVSRIRGRTDVDVASILATAALRPSDIRLLHAILLQRLGVAYDPELFEALVPLEVLVDIKANLSEYAVDVAGQYHNTYHALVCTLGAKAPEVMAAQLAAWQADYSAQLAKAPVRLRRRLEAFAERHERHYPSVPIPTPILTAVPASCPPLFTPLT